MRNLTLILLLLTIQNLFSQNTITVNSKRNKDNSVDIEYTKNKPGTYCIYLNFKNLENTLTPRNKFIVKDNSGFLEKLNPIDKNRFIKYSYTYSYRRGTPNPNVDTSFVYLLPFKSNTTVEVKYLNNLGTRYFDKEEPENFRAFQIIRDIPDTICSLRKGIVVSVINNYSIDTTHIYSYSSKRNSIMIEHNDGTFARYEGFDSENIFIKEGDTVLPNQPLGTLIQYDQKGTYQLRFAIYFLTEKPIEGENVMVKNSNKYLNPYFQTTEGIVKLKPKERYTTKISEEIILKELSKKEIKKRK